MNIEQVLEEMRERSAPALFLSEHSGIGVNEAFKNLKGAAEVALIIGPEGGWTENELKLADKYNAVPLNLGPRILRSDTAAIAALTLAQHYLGDIG